MLPQKLQQILNDHDPEDISISILKIVFECQDPTFKIRISGDGYNDESNYIIEWTVNTVRFRTSRLSFDFASQIVLLDNHPLLWQYSDKQSQLYFRGACSDSDKLFLDLYRVHNSIFGGLLNFESTINQAYNFGNLMKSRNALLASGPRQLMDEYRVVLERHNLECSIIGDRIPTYWDGENHVLENGSAKVLVIDNGYMIADAFEFTAD